MGSMDRREQIVFNSCVPRPQHNADALRCIADGTQHGRVALRKGKLDKTEEKCGRYKQKADGT